MYLENYSYNWIEETAKKIIKKFILIAGLGEALLYLSRHHYTFDILLWHKNITLKIYLENYSYNWIKEAAKKVIQKIILIAGSGEADQCPAAEEKGFRGKELK